MAPASIHRLPLTAEARLRLALRSLDAALAEQRQAVAGLRDAFAALGASVGGLSDGFIAYGVALDATSRELARADGEAKRLAVTAAAMGRLASP